LRQSGLRPFLGLNIRQRILGWNLCAARGERAERDYSG
jgi:hypothetical protein